MIRSFNIGIMRAAQIFIVLSAFSASAHGAKICIQPGNANDDIDLYNGDDQQYLIPFATIDHTRKEPQCYDTIETTFQAVDHLSRKIVNIRTMDSSQTVGWVGYYKVVVNPYGVEVLSYLRDYPYQITGCDDKCQKASDSSINWEITWNLSNVFGKRGAAFVNDDFGAADAGPLVNRSGTLKLNGNLVDHLKAGNYKIAKHIFYHEGSMGHHDLDLEGAEDH